MARNSGRDAHLEKTSRRWTQGNRKIHVCCWSRPRQSQSTAHWKFNRKNQPGHCCHSSRIQADMENTGWRTGLRSLAWWCGCRKHWRQHPSLGKKWSYRQRPRRLEAYLGINAQTAWCPSLRPPDYFWPCPWTSDRHSQRPCGTEQIHYWIPDYKGRVWRWRNKSERNWHSLVASTRNWCSGNGNSGQRKNRMQSGSRTICRAWGAVLLPLHRQVLRKIRSRKQTFWSG